MESFIRDYGKRISHLLLTSLKAGKGTNSHKRIHSFRLAVKRISALLQLIEKVSEDDEVTDAKQLLKPIRNTYQSAGKLRDLHVQKIIVKKLRRESRYDTKKLLKWIKAAKRIAIADFSQSCESLNPIGLEELRNNLMQHIFEHSQSITESKCKEFMADELSEVQRLHYATLTDKELHQIRKNLKRVYYTSQLLVEAGVDIDKYSYQLSRMDDLQEDLGHMNDLANFSLLLRELNAKTPDFPDIEWVVGVERAKLRNSLINKLKAFDI